MILGVVLGTVNGPSHVRIASLYTRNASAGLMRYFVAGRIFEVSAFLIKF